MQDCMRESMRKSEQSKNLWLAKPLLDCGEGGRADRVQIVPKLVLLSGSETQSSSFDSR